jgi:hypothetical protein
MRKASEQCIFYSRNSLRKAVDFTSSQGSGNYEIWTVVYRFRIEYSLRQGICVAHYKEKSQWKQFSITRVIMQVLVVFLNPNKNILNGYESFIFYNWLKITFQLN